MSSQKSAGWLSSLSKGGKWLAGVVVVALVGALVSVLVPRLFPPAELAAELSDVSIRSGVTLEEYAIRQEDPASGDSDEQAAVRGAGAMVLLSAQTTTSAEQITTSGEETKTTSGKETTTTGEQTTTTGEQTTTTGEQTTTTGEQTTTTEGPVVLTELDEADREALAAGVGEALEATPQPLILTPACRASLVSSACGLSSVATAMDLAGVTGEVTQVSRQKVARELVRIFKGTRTVRSPTDASKRELVGAAVDFNVSLTGFRGKGVQVRWSLYNARENVRVPRAWLRNQRILLLRGEADKDSASSDFWVPIPELRGPFFIRVGVYDDGGERLDYADTDSFR